MSFKKQRRTNLYFVILLLFSLAIGTIGIFVKIPWIDRIINVILVLSSFILMGLLLSLFEIGLNKIKTKENDDKQLKSL
ncbi:hypothetical protein [Neobacillus sp. YIM B06451]|uniref:hypothetical protein n=1 Tax=Neobacillus sp. YIM B06451 TaxID=3070994 RepID=UPI00292CD5BA|nr:hypothetical protein [Neobacillus sp. YIM B06451]